MFWEISLNSSIVCSPTFLFRILDEPQIDVSISYNRRGECQIVMEDVRIISGHSSYQVRSILALNAMASELENKHPEKYQSLDIYHYFYTNPITDRRTQLMMIIFPISGSAT